MTPIVSIVIPSYNRANLLPRALSSASAQTYQDIEIIVVDDASTDETRSVVSQFQEADQRIRYVQHSVNQGLSAARNTGIESARGGYIAFLDSDDEWLPHKLERQLAVFDQSTVNNLGLVYCGAIYFDEFTGVEVGRIAAKRRGDLLPDLLDYNCITAGGSTALVKREAFAKCGLFDTCDLLRRGGAEDTDMWTRIAYHYGFDFANDFLTRMYIQRAASLSTKEQPWTESASAHEYVLAKHATVTPGYPKAMSNHLYRIGRLYLFGGMTKQGRSRFLSALRYNPANLKAWLSLGASLFGWPFYKWAYGTLLPLLGSADSRDVMKTYHRRTARVKA